MNWSGDVWEKRDHLFYRCWLSRLYHQKRERFFDVCDRLTQAVAMTGGMTFIVSACSPEHWVIMAALITASATLSLAVGYPKKARAHADLAKAFMALEAQMVGQGVLDMTQAARFEAEILRIEMNEPRALGALVRICQNQMAAVCGKVQDIQAVPWWKWLLAHIDDFDMSAPSSTFR